MKNVTFEGKALAQFLEWLRENPKMHQKIAELIVAVAREPFQGIGKPEPLQHELRGHWSRRIDDTHRLVYRVSDEAVTIVSCKYHYSK